MNLHHLCRQDQTVAPDSWLRHPAGDHAYDATPLAQVVHGHSLGEGGEAGAPHDAPLPTPAP